MKIRGDYFDETISRSTFARFVIAIDIIVMVFAMIASEKINQFIKKEKELQIK